MIRRKRQEGQGLIEYMLVLAVVVIAVVAFAITFKDSAENAGTTMTDNIDAAVSEMQSAE